MAVRLREVVRGCALALALAMPLLANAADLTDDERAFVTKAEAACMAEAGMADLAVQRATDPVKHLAQTIVDYCHKVELELQALTEIDPASVALSSAQTTTRSKLEKIDQSHFDSRYLAAVVDDHQAMIQLFTKAGPSIVKPRLKEFATVTLAHLQANLDEAKRLQAAKPRPA